MTAVSAIGSGVVVAESDEEVKACWDVFRVLRPHITSPDDFLARYRDQAPETYRIAYVRGEGGAVAGAAGYRVMHTMAWGRICYLDDLIVDPAVKGTGLGSRLLGFLKDEAVRLGCTGVHLDTGYQRNDAHRAYLRNGFDLICHHLEWKAQND